MTCKLVLTCETLELCIPYKYVVYTSKSQSKQDGCYEFIRLPNKRIKDPNRVLRLTPAQLDKAVSEG